MVDLRQLRYFVAIVDQKSFSKAAILLRVAQPALSLHVRNMEADFGVRLLTRSPQGVRPTEAGEILFRDAKAIIRQFEATRDEIRGQNIEPHGGVCVGITPANSTRLGAPLLLEARGLYPKIKLRVVEAMSGFILDWLRDGRVDAAILHHAVNDHGLTSCLLSSDELVLVGSANPPDDCGFRDRDTISGDEMAGIPLILPGLGHGQREAIEASASAADIELNVVLDLDLQSCMKHLVEQGVGYSLAIGSSVADEVKQGRLRSWAVRRPSIMRSNYLVHGEIAMLSAAARAVIDLCKLLPRTGPDKGGRCRGGGTLPGRRPGASGSLSAGGLAELGKATSAAQLA